ncbi:uncharacterized protein PHALS_13752 [Plasmopara halstedii]|uniref:RXLR phytopathogen effector protein WY-domain domain-containing protein n=1 Tax=Plasmopara halstedii TaxID=4781 RepID=A0A0P1ARK1_PLAHL|nr:uncharacterized protein PHALS_13752 [Plasmopara halstedii]CEG43560.1 hypothetical protein PHALS_13752 [Plasmopara halstedii]|eukprot:XP_024579929.1 hypothetical protein PHALS_13752 [Plasmopara halstedii]
MMVQTLKEKWSHLSSSEIFTKVFPMSDRSNILMSPSVRIWIELVGLGPKGWQSELLKGMLRYRDSTHLVVGDIIEASDSGNILSNFADQVKRELLSRWRDRGLSDDEALEFCGIRNLKGEKLLEKRLYLEMWIEHMSFSHESNSVKMLYSFLTKHLNRDELLRLLFMKRKPSSASVRLSQVEDMVIENIKDSAKSVLDLVTHNADDNNSEKAISFWLRFVQKKDEGPGFVIDTVLDMYDVESQVILRQHINNALQRFGVQLDGRTNNAFNKVSEWLEYQDN